MSASKYLALAFAAYSSKQYEEAGVFFAQAAQEPDLKEVTDMLGSPDLSYTVTASQRQRSVSGGDELFEEDEWDDEQVSVSSVNRRKMGSLHQVARIISASMELSESASDEFNAHIDDEDVEDLADQISPDPDLPGESMIPVSFSAVKVKISTSNDAGGLQSPIKLRK
jgi:hypothetical protein